MISLKKKPNQNWQSTVLSLQPVASIACSWLLSLRFLQKQDSSRKMAERGRTQGQPSLGPHFQRQLWQPQTTAGRGPSGRAARNDLLLAETVTSQPKPKSSQNSPNQITLIFGNTVKPSSCPPFLFYPFFHLSSPNLPETVETLTRKELLSGYQGEKKNLINKMWSIDSLATISHQY